LKGLFVHRSDERAFVFSIKNPHISPKMIEPILNRVVRYLTRAVAFRD
jgi:hypothetical protein